MSIHKIPLTDLEREGLTKHYLAVDAASQLSDCFRFGMKWAQDNASQNEWISVGDRLPKDAQLVLFRLKNATKTEKGMHLAGCKTFETEYSCDFYNYDDVTHWMPLPTPPKEI